ncbi:MAG: hypothetical protein WCC25_13320 [Candidatus Korobacteraceae bacterium]
MMDRPHVLRVDDNFADDSLFEPVPRFRHERATAHLNSLLPTLCAVFAVLWFFFGRH